MNYFDKQGNKLIVYLAELDHIQPSNRYFIPMGIGSLASYAKSIYGDLIEISLFKNPNELIEKIRECPPHILGCSFFMWNANLTLKMVQACRAVDGRTVTVIGGSSTARNCDRYIEILNNNPSLDIIALDQGEKTFINIINRVLEKDFDREAIFSQSIDGCALRIDSFGKIARGNIVIGGVDINTFPSPYLAGYFDKFLEAGYVPLFETVRGCPHQCTYCGGGIGSFLPLSIRDEKDVYDEILYIAERTKTNQALIGDTNFGIMGERDLRISAFMLDLYKRTGFPQLLYYNLTKQQTNTSNETLSNLTKMVGTLHFALQTMTPEVLKNCKRINIPVEMVKELCNKNRKSKNPVPVMVDLIFGLPGETLKSFMKTIDDVLALGIEYPSVLLLKMLPGTTIAEDDRDKYGYKTKFRPIEGRYGEYDLFSGQKPIRVIESEEMACSNNSFDFNDYLTVRYFCLIARLLSSCGAMADTLFYLSEKDVTITEIFKMVMQNKDKYPRLKKLFDDYEFYSRNELFDSEEDLYNKIAGDDEQWADLLAERGKFFKLELGFASYCLFENVEVLNDIKEVILNSIKNRLTIEEIEDLCEVMRHDELLRIMQKRPDRNDGRISEVDLQEEIITFDSFDYEAWRSKGFKGHIKDFSLPEKVKKVYRVYKLDLIKHIINKFSSLSGYLFYEKIIMWGPRNFKRLCLKEDTQDQPNLCAEINNDSKLIIAIIPARGGSKGIPKKNIIDFCGKPLLSWSIEQANASKYIDQVYVSTDDSEIAQIARQYGARVIDRPEDISGDTATSESALLHALDEIEKSTKKVKYIVFLQATSPLRETKDIDNAVETLINEDADSLFSGVEFGDFCIWKREGGELKSINYDYKNRKRRQDFEQQYEENGSIYVFTPDVLRTHNNRLGKKISISLMEFWKIFEIDSKDDLELCGHIFKLKGLDKK